MALSLSDYKVKLINKILFSISQDQVKYFIDTAMKVLTVNNINGHLIDRFVEKMISELEQFNPMNKDAQQWSNIRMAKIHFNRIRQQLKTTAN